MTPDELEERLLTIEAKQVELLAGQSALVILLADAKLPPGPALGTQDTVPSGAHPPPAPLLHEFLRDFVQQRRFLVQHSLEQLENMQPGKAARLRQLLQDSSPLPEV